MTTASSGGLYTQFANSSEIVNETIGLELSLSINSTLISSGQSLLINITELNTLSRMNNVLVAEDWAMNGLTLPCGEITSASISTPIGIAVIKGYYTTDNVSAASQINFVNFTQPDTFCAPFLPFVTFSYYFRQNSDVASPVYCSGNCGVVNVPEYRIGELVPVSGNWTNTASQPKLVVLAPGVYTVAGGDEWGNLEVLHFQTTK
jgi:hypothetical protein